MKTEIVGLDGTITVSVDAMGISIIVRGFLGGVWIPLKYTSYVTGLFKPTADNKCGWQDDRNWYTVRWHEQSRVFEAISLSEQDRYATVARVTLDTGHEDALIAALTKLPDEYTQQKTAERREMLERRIAEAQAELAALEQETTR